MQEVMKVLANEDAMHKHFEKEDYDNRMMRVVRQYNYEHRTNYDAHSTFLDYLLSD